MACQILVHETLDGAQRLRGRVQLRHVHEVELPIPFWNYENLLTTGIVSLLQAQGVFGVEVIVARAFIVLPPPQRRHAGSSSARGGYS